MIELSDDVCPYCGEKTVRLPASPLDNLGCPNCGSQLVTNEPLCDMVSPDLFVLDLTCESCGFEWLEGRVLPKRLLRHKH